MLGVAYHELGAGIGMRWKLSDAIVAGMRPLSRGDLPPCNDDGERLQICAAFANTVSRIVVDAESKEALGDALAELLERAVLVVRLDVEELTAHLDEAAQLTRQYARLLKLGAEPTAACQRLVETPPLAGAA